MFKIESLLSDRLAARLARLLGISFALRASWAVLNFLGVVFLARWMTPDAFGSYAVIISLVTQATVICSLGGQSTLVRYLGQYQSHKDYSLAHGVVRYFRARTGILSVVFAVASALAAIVAQQLGMIDDALPFVIGFAMLPAFVVADIQTAIARSFGATFVALAPKDVIWRGALIPIAFLVTMTIQVGLQLHYILGIAAIAMTVLAYLQKVGVDRATPAAIALSPPTYRPAEWRAVATPIWVATVAGVAFASLDVVTLGLYLDAETVGQYFVASRTAILLSFFLAMIDLVVGPDIARTYYEDDRERLAKTLRFSSFFVFVPTFMLFLTFAFGGPMILSWFGPNFENAYPQLLILSCGQLFNAVTGSTRVVFEATGNQNFATRVVLITAVITSLGVAGAAYFFGATAVALVVATGIAVLNLVLWFFARTRLRIDPSLYGAIFGQPSQAKA